MGKLQKIWKAQMQLQMLAANTRKGYFCVVDANFEETKDIVIRTEHFDENFVMDMIEKATEYWKLHVFPSIFNAL